jgi:alpha,alpha-trehalose phosphorylase
MPYDERLGVHPQAEGFTNHDQWDFRHTRTDQYPLLLHFPYFDLYGKQVVKQADLVLAMYLCGDAFTPEEKLRNFAYYDAITVRDSSLSASVQAILAAEVGALDLAYDYLGGPRSLTSTTASATLATGFTSPRSQGHGRYVQRGR